MSGMNGLDEVEVRCDFGLRHQFECVSEKRAENRVSGRFELVVAHGSLCTWKYSRHQRHFGPSALLNRRESTEGHTLSENFLMENVCKKKETCCSRNVGSSFFQSLGVARHVPFMVWRDGPERSDDSEVSNGGVRLDRRRELQHHVRTVSGYCTT